MSEEFNPFAADDSGTVDADTNPFGDDDDEEDHHDQDDFFGRSPSPPPQIDNSEIEIVEDPKPIIQADEKKTGLPSYTSLDDEQQVATIMRSVSMDEDNIITANSDTQELFVKVDSPEKHVEGYVSYAVTTKTTRNEFDLHEYKVRRRYQDFLWLRQKMEDSCPTHIIPALPEKFTFSKHITDKFDQDFLKTRQKALDKFMSRLVDHPVMSFNENLKTFLTAKAWEMSTARKKGPGATTKVGGTMRNTAAQFMMKNRDEEFNQMGTYNSQFQAKMKKFSTIADTVAQERFYLLDDYAEYGSGFRLWANSESRLADTLSGVANSLDKSSESLKNILRVHEQRICEPLREYALYCESVKVALKRRDQIQIEHELSSEELQKRRAEKEEIESTGQAKSLSTLFGKDPEQVKEEKLTKLNEQIRDLQSESEALSDKRATADQDFRADMERWQKNKKRDIKALMLEIAERHIKFYEANVGAWQTALDVIGQPNGGE